MKTIIKITLFSFMIALFTACGGGMSKNNLVGKKWSFDMDALEKEMERVVSKLGTGPMVDMIKTQVEKGFKEQKGEMEKGTIEFKEDGTLEATLEGLPAPSQNDVKWSLEGGKLYFAAEGEKFGFNVSGSGNKMKLTITKDDVMDIMKKQGQELPKEVEPILTQIGSVSIPFKAE